MTASRGDFRNYNRMERSFSAQIEQQVAALKATLQAEIAANAQRAKDMDAQLAAMIAQLAAATAALEKRQQAVDLGILTVTIGSTLSITTAGTQRMVLPFAGVRATDVLWARPDEYLPTGYGLPQIMCRNAGQIEVRITTPSLALGTTKTINLAITALR